MAIYSNENGSQPLRPPLPTAKRLNRNALLVVALVLGLTTIVVIVTMRPENRAASKSEEVTTPRSGTPDFLRTPVKTPSTPGDEMDFEGGNEYSFNGDIPFERQSYTSTMERGLDPYARYGLLPDQDPYTLDFQQNPSKEVATTPREEAYQRALRSDPLGEDGKTMTSSSKQNGNLPLNQELDIAATDEAWLNAITSLTNTNSLTQGSLGTVTPTSKPTPSSHTAFLTSNTNRNNATDSEAQTTVNTPTSPFVVNAGTVLSGILTTSVVSDLPGEIIGQVSYNIYDSPKQQHLLIPKGSKLIGTYDNGIALGQKRLLVAWTRLIFPDGRSITLPGLTMSDAKGASGVSDKVDNHYGRIFGNAVALSAISAGIQLSQPRQSSTIFSTPSAGQAAAGALGQELGLLSTEMIRRNLDIRPTITIRAGMPFTVILRGDIVLPGPYVSGD